LPDLVVPAKEVSRARENQITPNFARHEPGRRRWIALVPDGCDPRAWVALFVFPVFFGLSMDYPWRATDHDEVGLDTGGDGHLD
jgi:hypothetical protein